MLQSIKINNIIITDPAALSYVFNHYLFSKEENTKSNIKFSPKYTNYLSNTNSNIFFLSSTDKNDISFIISRFTQVTWPKQHSCENSGTTKNYLPLPHPTKIQSLLCFTRT